MRFVLPICLKFEAEDSFWSDVCKHSLPFVLSAVFNAKLYCQYRYRTTAVTQSALNLVWVITEWDKRFGSFIRDIALPVKEVRILIIEYVQLTDTELISHQTLTQPARSRTTQTTNRTQ